MRNAYSSLGARRPLHGSKNQSGATRSSRSTPSTFHRPSIDASADDARSSGACRRRTRRRGPAGKRDAKGPFEPRPGFARIGLGMRRAVAPTTRCRASSCTRVATSPGDMHRRRATYHRSWSVFSTPPAALCRGCRRRRALLESSVQRGKRDRHRAPALHGAYRTRRARRAGPCRHASVIDRCGGAGPPTPYAARKLSSRALRPPADASNASLGTRGLPVVT